MSWTLDLSFLGEGEHTAEIFEDGINADRNACDYRRVETSLGDADRSLSVSHPAGVGPPASGDNEIAE